MGEGVAAEQLRCGSILYGLEMGKVKNATLDGWHAWCLSEVMGIGRYTKEEGYTGVEANSACVWANYSKQTWSQTSAYTDQYTAWKTVHYPRKLCWQGMGELIY